MKVRFRQTGDFGGLVLGCDLDKEDLSQPDRKALSKLVKQRELPQNGIAVVVWKIARFGDNAQ